MNKKKKFAYFPKNSLKNKISSKFMIRKNNLSIWSWKENLLPLKFISYWVQSSHLESRSFFKPIQNFQISGYLINLNACSWKKLSMIYLKIEKNFLLKTFALSLLNLLDKKSHRFVKNLWPHKSRWNLFIRPSNL